MGMSQQLRNESIQCDQLHAHRPDPYRHDILPPLEELPGGGIKAVHAGEVGESGDVIDKYR